MRVPLAWCSLVHAKLRTLVVLAGMTFVLILIFLQLGFYGTVRTTATQFFDHVHFDILLVSADYLILEKPGTFPRDRLAQATAVPGVLEAMPLYTGMTMWRNPVTRHRQRITVIGFDLRDQPFRLPELADYREVLRKMDTVLIDRRTRPEYGPQDAGTVTEVDNRRVHIGGQVTLGTGFGAFGNLIVSDQNFVRLMKGGALDSVTIGLVRLQPAVAPDEAAARLRAALPADVRVLTRRDIEEQETHYWLRLTPAGLMFSLGVFVAFTVGTVILYQVLTSDLTRHRKEYATLKAIGYPDRFLLRVVLQKAVLLAGLAYLPALVIALGLYAVISEATQLPIRMNAGRGVAVFLLTLVMCSFAGLVSLRRLRAADPADLF